MRLSTGGYSKPQKDESFFYYHPSDIELNHQDNSMDISQESERSGISSKSDSRSQRSVKTLPNLIPIVNNPNAGAMSKFNTFINENFGDYYDPNISEKKVPPTLLLPKYSEAQIKKFYLKYSKEHEKLLVGRGKMIKIENDRNSHAQKELSPFGIYLYDKDIYIYI